MADLVTKYFQEDLTEAEDQALEETLMSSPVDANQFVELAREAYLRYGLPDPKLSPRGSQGGGGLSGSGRTWLWALALLGSVTALYLAWHFLKAGKITPPPTVSPAKPHSTKSMGTGTSAPSLSVYSQIAAKPYALHSLAADSTRTSLSLTPATGQKSTGMEKASVLPTPGNTGSPAAGMVSGSVPPSSSADEHHKGLEVTVREESPQPVTVKVLKADGTLLVSLYQGLLQTGKWVFEWNGKLADGSPAGPGSYQIQVTSGSTTRSKTVFIRQHNSD